MIGWLIFLGYMAGWAVTAPILAKVIYATDTRGQCSKTTDRLQFKVNCLRYHSKECWTTGPLGFGDAAMGAVGAIFWPLLIFPAYVYTLSTHEPKHIKTARKIAALEKEAGL